MRSDRMKKGWKGAAPFAVQGAGVTDRKSEQPMIGIANSANEVILGHLHSAPGFRGSLGRYPDGGRNAAGVLHDRRCDGIVMGPKG